MSKASVTPSSSSSFSSSAYKALGEELWKKTEKINAELFILTYGALVAALIQEHGTLNLSLVNAQLDKMGYHIGVRLIDEFFAKANLSNATLSCSDFKETVELIAKVGFKMFLGITPSISQWSSDGKECTLVFEENPLIEFVELPSELVDGTLNRSSLAPSSASATTPAPASTTATNTSLVYCQLYCGVLRGALEQVQLQVECHISQDPLLTGSSQPTELRLKWIKKLEDEAPIDF